MVKKELIKKHFFFSFWNSQATAALTCLYRIHELKKRGPVPNSLVLSNILHVCNPDIEKRGFFAGTVSKIKLWKYLKAVSMSTFILEYNFSYLKKKKNLCNYFCLLSSTSLSFRTTNIIQYFITNKAYSLRELWFDGIFEICSTASKCFWIFYRIVSILENLELSGIRQ